MNDETSSAYPDPDTNPDAITGAPGSHPVATGIGAAGAGLTGAVVGMALGGPAGGVIGSVVGAIVGGYTGKAAGEAVDPTLEDAYWRENHRKQHYAGSDDFEEYRHAYRTGYQGYAKRGEVVRDFGAAEPDLQQDYESSNPQMPWDQARHASRAAWERLSENGGVGQVPAAEGDPTVGVRRG